MNWKLKEQEQQGTYRFDGRCGATKQVAEDFEQSVLSQIIQAIHQKVEDNDGIDYLQVVEFENGTILWVIDQINDEMKPDHPKAHNYFTILYPSEY